jgi:hypothetical protein
MLHTGKERKLLGVLKLRFTVLSAQMLASFTCPIPLGEVILTTLLAYRVSVDKTIQQHQDMKTETDGK